MLKLNVGLSRKVGEANYGSRGASVNLELEVESGLAGDPETLRDRIRQLFRMARVSVDEELSGGRSADDPHSNGDCNGRGNGDSRRQSNGRSAAVRSATASQVRALHAIANRQRIDLTAELHSRFGVERPEDLSITQASELIDAIKPPDAHSGQADSRQTSGGGARR